MIAIGYLVTFSYIFIMVFGLGGLMKKLFSLEISRKLIHISLFMVWFFIDIFFKNTIHQIIIPVSFLIVNSISYKFKIFKTIEREDDNHLGTIYFAAAVLIIFTLAFFNKDLYPHTGPAFMCLTFGDGFASLFGHIIKSKKIYKNKSLSGFIFCILGSLLGMLFLKITAFNELAVLNIILLSFICGIVELVDYGLDNFSIVFIIFILSYLFTIGDALLLSNAIIVAIIIFFIVFITKAIKYYGALLAMLIVVLFTYFGGYSALAFLLISYFISFIISVMRKLLKHNDDNIVKKSKGKDFIQIFVNGYSGSICVVLYGITDNPSFLIVAFICIAASLIDSISSDIGTLSKSKPYDIFRRKRVEKGLSGGVSLLGTIASILAAVILAIIAVLLLRLDYIYILILSPLMLVNTFIDTILGSLFQAKYRCVECNIITERNYHCDKPTVLASGFRIINNDVVNFISAFCVMIISIILV